MKIQARGKRRVADACSCGRMDAQHAVAPVEGRTFEEKQEAFERVQLAFGAPPPKRAPARLSPDTVLILRSLGCKLPSYPEFDTCDWARFALEYERTKENRNKMLDALPKRKLEWIEPEERKTITETPL
jgi:hypothetical protein